MVRSHTAKFILGLAGQTLVSGILLLINLLVIPPFILFGGFTTAAIISAFQKKTDAFTYLGFAMGVPIVSYALLKFINISPLTIILVGLAMLTISLAIETLYRKRQAAQINASIREDIAPFLNASRRRRIIVVEIEVKVCPYCHSQVPSYEAYCPTCNPPHAATGETTKLE